MAVRLSADWMTKADDRILEFLDVFGHASPQIMADDDRLPFARAYMNQRLLLLVEAGLCEKAGAGIYRITDKGKGYLEGQEDLLKAPKPAS